MRIVVAGGTGFIGRRVVERLLAQGVGEVAATSRQPGQSAGGRIEVLQAFAGDPLSLGKAFARADVVVQCIQFPNHPVENPARGHTYLEVDGRGTRVAVQMAKKAGVRRFVYVSGAGAGQGRPQRWFQAKDMAEQALRESGMEHAILRPSWIHGPGDHSMQRLVAFCRYLPFVPVIGDGQNRIEPLFVDDAARCIAEAALRDDCKDTTFELGGPERMTMNEVLRTVQRVIGRRAPLLHHPIGFMKLASRFLAVLPEPPLSPDAIDFVTQEVPLDPGPAIAHFGFPFRTLEASLRSYLV
jgi:NADH dehydrogenase